ncbi:hypothetical protein TAF16_1577 [Anoxybacillus flavithermus]|uniref:Uncharacterized protein n=1 Tax=Anoxybacillus flavithermus TaxID=33934 RepID=A0A178TC25_9BACL|nr:hypothetical protein TAF16_1577 [Anoxybacillus flavithermus]
MHGSVNNAYVKRKMKRIKKSTFIQKKIKKIVVKTENDCIIKIKIVQSFSQNDIVKAFVYV